MSALESQLVLVSLACRLLRFTSIHIALQVTGVNGYLGAHVVDRLVQDGYRVRGTVRASKWESTRKSYASYGETVEIVVADDLVNGSFPEIFRGTMPPPCLDIVLTYIALKRYPGRDPYCRTIARKRSYRRGGSERM